MKREFEHCAEDYAQYRPAYPMQLLDELREAVGDAVEGHIVDLGAGTGIFSASLSRFCAPVVAIDPSLAMLKQIPATLPVVCLLGQAECIPLQDCSTAVVTVAQAFHWFYPPLALAEIARILQPEGWLLLCWNNRIVAPGSFVSQFETLIQQYNPKYQCEYRQQDWAGKIKECGAFSTIEQRDYKHEWILSREAFQGFTRSVTYIRNVLSREEMESFSRKLQLLIASYFPDEVVKIPLRTESWWARRQSAPAGRLNK
ncbi:MAG: hypothetical protein HJJLKODD_00205 [Phycisphaerae bacterium]|nr:hypothetical protein [Phycisphaerae bacterium]